MKQYITKEQLQELNEKALKRLHNWWKPKIGDLTNFGVVSTHVFSDNTISVANGIEIENDVDLNIAYPLLSIGQMIEFLEENSQDKHFIGQRWFEYVIKETRESGDILIPYTTEELCDALWEAVKEVLEEKK